MAAILCGLSIENSGERSIIEAAARLANIVVETYPEMPSMQEALAGTDVLQLPNSVVFDFTVSDASQVCSDFMPNPGLDRTILICDAVEAGAPSANGNDCPYLMKLYRPLETKTIALHLQHAAQFIQLSGRREKLLNAELSRAKMVLDSVTSGIAIADATLPDLPLVYTNKSFEKMTGYTSHEIYGKNCRFLQGVEHDQPALASVRAAIRDQVAVRAILKNFRKDGTSFWNELNLSPMHGSSGRVTHFVGIQHDVSAQVEAGMRIDLLEDFVAEGQRKLRTVIGQMDEAIVGLNRSGEVVHANSKVYALCDVEEPLKEGVSLLDCIDVLNQDDRPLPREEWPGIRALRGDYVQRLIVRIRNKQTSRSRLTEVSTAPVLNMQGEPDLVLVMFHDVTEQVRMEQQRSMLAAIVDSSKDAIVSSDLTGSITSWNDSAERLFGYRAADIMGTSVAQLIPMKHHAKMLQSRTKILNGETVEESDLAMLRKDGGTIYASITVSPIRNATGMIVGASRVIRDITVKKQMERHVQQSHKMEALGKLTGGIAHEFNNLLAIIMGNVELVEATLPENDVAVRRLQAAQKAAIRGAELTRRLLTLSSKNELAPEPVMLNATIAEMLKLSGDSPDSEIKLVTHLSPDVTSVFVDAVGFESAILQIVTNAREAMPRGGTLIVTTELATVDKVDLDLPGLADLLPGQYAKVSISDTGCGMPKDVLDHAFEPFYTTKGSHRSSGLGLSMAFGFVTQSGGAIHLYSETGFGTTLTFYLPLTQSLAEAIEQDVSAEQTVRTGAVLIVDDQPDLLDIAAAYLEEMGHRVLRATGSKTALAMAAEHPEINLLLTDVVMPGDTGGVQLAAEILALRPTIKVIFCSGFTAASLTEKAAGLSGGPLLHKPYQRTQFRTIVQRAMDSGGNSQW